jgi:hypothetical protein
MAHTHYKGTGKMHSFRGNLADGKQQRIRIQGPVGAIAWRITKFQILPLGPGVATQELVCKIFREEQTAVSGTLDFTDDELLGAAIFAQSADSYNTFESVIFDNSLFSRNIWITMDDSQNTAGGNYYLELEEVKVSAAGMAQLAVAAARRVWVPT